MTNKEMQQECQKHKKCDKCKLCFEDLWDEYNSWCFMDVHKRYVNKYKMHMEHGEKEKAEETAKEYTLIEQKYLGSIK